MLTVIVRCETCGTEFRYGKDNFHNGKKLRGYGIMVCSYCYDYNWDGWNPQYETILENSLDNQGKEYPERNEKGLYPREF